MANASKIFEIAFQLGGEISPTMRKAFDEAKNSLGDFQKSSSITNKAMGAMKVGAAATAGAIGAIGTALIAAAKAGDEYNSAMAQIQASTGASTEDMAEIKEISKNLYNQNLGEDFNDLADAISKARQVTQLQGKDLQKVTQDALVYRDVFGEDITESVKTSDTMMKNFGITSSQAYNLLAQGAQKGLNKSDELLDSANEYAPYFSQLGFSANDMFSTFSTGLKNGAFNLDKVGDAVKEFNIRSKDGSKATMEAYADLGLQGDKLTQTFARGGPEAQKAFRKVVNAIADVKDPAKQSQLAVSLFGTQAEDLEIGVIKSLGNVKGQFDMTKNTMESVKNIKYDTLGNTIKGMGRQFYTGFVLPISDAVLPAFQLLSDWMSTAIPKITSTLGKAFSGVSTMVSKMWSNLKSNDGLSKYIETAKVIFNGIISAVQTVMPYIKQALGEIASFVMSIVSKVSSFWSQNGSQIISAVKNVFSIIRSIVSFVMPLVLMIIKSIWGNIKGVITGALDIIMGAVKIFSGLFTGDFSKMWEGTKQLFSGSIRFIWNLVNLMFYGKILGGIRALASGALKNIGTLWSGIKNFFSSGISSVNGKIVGFVKSIGGGFKAAKDVAVTMAKEMWHGIRNHFNSIVDGARALPGRIGKGIKSMAHKALDGIASMGNKLLIGLGKIINGVINGINHVMDKMAIKTQIPNWNVPQYARGTNSHPGGPAILGDGGGPELYRMPNGTVGLSPGTDTMMYLPKGTQVIPHRETAAALKQTGTIPKYAHGTGVKDAVNTGIDWLKNAGSTALSWAKTGLGKAKSVAGDVMEVLSNPSKVFDYILNKFNVTAPDGVSGIWEKIGSRGFSLVKEKVIDFLTEKIAIYQATSGADFGSYRPFNGNFNAITNNFGVYDYLYDLAKQVIAQNSGLVITSGQRNGDPYDHGKHKAIDLSGWGRNGGYKSLAQSLSTHPYLSYTIGDNTVFGRKYGNGSQPGWAKGHMNHLHMSALDPSTAKKAKFVTGGGAESWISQIKNAAAQMKVKLSASELAGIVAQIQRESSGSPSAIQSSSVVDVNSRSGNPARGLLQYVPSTFRTYAVKGYGDVMNGYHQLLAFFNNSNWRSDLPYGKSGWSPSGARRFAHGGTVTSSNPFWVGERGPELMEAPFGTKITNHNDSKSILNNIKTFATSSWPSFKTQKEPTVIQLDYSPKVVVHGKADKSVILQALQEHSGDLKEAIRKVLKELERDEDDIAFE